MLTEFAGNLAHHLEFGHTLEIVAKTIDSASRFYILLSTAKSIIDPTANIGLRLLVNFREKYVALNCRIDGQWRKDSVTNFDQHAITKPIVSGEFFVIYILMGENRFHISINSKAFCVYDYHLPIDLLRTIEIKDQIQVIKQIDHRTIFPNPWPPVHASDYFKAFSSDAPILFRAGHLIVITARCFNNKKGQFIIKFMDADTKKEDIHFSVRFDQKVVVRNSMNKNFEFGPEERHGGFPFVFNQQFKLALAFTEKELLAALDGNLFCSYAYRTPNILQNLVGFKITCINGLSIHVTGVDHIKLTDPRCSQFETYSRPDYECA